MRKIRNTALGMRKLAVIGAALALSIGLFPGTANAVEAPLSLGTAATYGVLANTAVTSATPSGITGAAGANVGVGSATPPTGTISVAGSTVLGGVSITALSDATAALSDNRGGVTTGVELGTTTKTPGAYNNPTLEVNGVLTLDALGNSSAVFIFRSASTLITGTSSSVLLVNGAQACNVYWQVGSSATLGASSTIVGHVIAYAAITTGTSSFVNGQLIATTAAVTLGGTTIVNNGCSTSVVTPTPVATVAPTPVATVAPTPVVTLEETPEPTPSSESTKPVPATESGGLLPTTSTPWANLLLIGGVMVGAGAAIFGARKIMNHS